MEVIIVLVILAILAAIAIPALTGYITKAQDKKWEMKARDAVTACRAVLAEVYGDATMASGIPDNDKYLITGRSDWFTGSTYTNKLYQLSVLSFYNTGTTSTSEKQDPGLYFRKAAELMGETFPEEMGKPGSWEVRLAAPKTPDTYTILDAPIFWYLYYPKGDFGSGWGGGGKLRYPAIAVTYGVNIDPAISTYKAIGDALAIADYDPSAGYRVLHLDK
ncbi:MAG: hypothetical protein LBO70_08545 [Clostridiales Family XIII bacterium]|nr:hypothetical protein [Clostridiales Family XIII bacterium]